ncbi:MAG: BatA domain-containing protein [Vicinamibacterales bacterium]
MSFLSPLFLVGVAAAAVPILLHLLRRRPEGSVKFPAVRLLQHSPVEHTSRRRLRELLLLALRVAALVLLSVAFARPFLAATTAVGSGGVTVVALDTSLSLSTPERMARAQTLAREAVQAAPSGHMVGVVTFADAATVAAEPAADRALAVAAVDASSAGAGATRYRPALEAAEGLIAAHGDGSGRIVVVTDLQAGGWTSGDRLRVPEGVQVEVADVGALPDNLAVVAARIEGERDVVATLANFGAEPREARLSVEAGGRQIGPEAVTVGAGSTASVRFAEVEGDRATVRVDDPNGLQADNERRLVMQGRNVPSVLVVTAAGDLEREAFYLQQALTAAGTEGSAFAVEGAGASTLSTWDDTRIDQHAAVVLLSTRGLEQRGRQLLRGFVERGGGLLLAAGPEVDGQIAAEAVAAPVSMTMPESADLPDPRGAGRAIVPSDIRHPVFLALTAAGAALGPSTYQRVATIDSPDCQPIARFTTGEPALLDCSQGSGRTLIFGSDLDQRWNTLPRHAAFVPFVHEVLRYLAGARGDSNELTVGATEMARQPGFVTLPAGDGGGRLIAINPDPEESEPARQSPEAFLESISTGPAGSSSRLVEARQQEDRQRIWRYALLAMIAMLVAESALASRPV